MDSITLVCLPFFCLDVSLVMLASDALLNKCKDLTLTLVG